MKVQYVPFTQSEIQKIIQILQKGDRVELIPTKDKIKIIHITRKEVTE